MRKLGLVASLLSLALYFQFFGLQAVEQDLPDIPTTPPEIAELLHLGQEINSPYTEYTPFITPDETYLYFESDRPGGVGMTGDYDLWYSKNKTPRAEIPSFSVPANLGPRINTAEFDGLPSLRKLPEGGYELYFTSVPSESRGGPLKANIYYSRTQNGEWDPPRLVDVINSDFDDRMPSISSDGETLYFSSNRPGGFGSDDIWMSTYDKKSKRWSEPVNLGSAVNGGDSEISPSIHVDGITLYFSSNRPGGVGNYDIYVTQKLRREGMWKKPQNLGIPYNSQQDDEYPTVLRSGEYMYFTSNRTGGYGGFDIYRARVPHFAKPMVVVTLEGRVFEMNTTKGIEANIQVRGAMEKYDVSTGLPGGHYTLRFLNNNIYEIFVSAPGFENEKFILDLRSTHEEKTIKKDFALRRLHKIESSIRVRLEYFDTDGNAIAALSRYMVSPGMTDYSVVQGDVIELNLPVDESERLAFLRTHKLVLVTSATGYRHRTAEVPLSELLEDYSTAGGEILLPVQMIPLVMKNGEKNTNGLMLIDVIYFDTDVSDKVRESEKAKIEAAAQKLKKTQGIIELHGHTDKRGSLKKNNSLSKNRAEYIKRELINAGIPENRIRLYWHNYSRPKVEGDSEKDMARNRRVEIYLEKNHDE